MKNIPQWLRDLLSSSDLKCNKCDKSFKANQLKAIGIRDSCHKSSKETLFIELICSSCSEMTMYELREMSLIELSYEVMDDFELSVEDMDQIDKNKGRKDLKKELNEDINEGFYVKKKRKKSKITLKEVKDSAKFLESLKTHEEFLIAIGMSPEEIDKYSITKIEKKKKNDK